jgi:hypothetical protein
MVVMTSSQLMNLPSHQNISSSISVYIPTAYPVVSHTVFWEGRCRWSRLDGTCRSTSEHRRGPPERVIPYVMLVVSIKFSGGAHVIDELRLTMDEISYQSNGGVVAMRGMMKEFCRVPSALYRWLEGYPFTSRKAYLTLSESISNAVGAPVHPEFVCFLQSYLPSI